MPDADLVLVIDDEPQIRRAVRDALRDVASRVDEAGNGWAGVDAAATNHPDLVVLDLGLPDMAGVDVCREIRQLSAVPIIVLSARHSEHEKVDLLNAGADDYVTKPFSTIELKARVRALQRRANVPRSIEAKTIVNGALRMDLEARTLTRSGEPVHLTPTEWDLLRVLMADAGKTMTHRQLFAAVWPGRKFGDAQQYLRVHIANVRRKIESNPLDPQYIVTEPGVGYRFTPSPAPRKNT